MNTHLRALGIPAYLAYQAYIVELTWQVVHHDLAPYELLLGGLFVAWAIYMCPSLIAKAALG